MAELRSYSPTWRDRIAAALLGDTHAATQWGDFVQGLVGSTGLGATGPSAVDFTPVGMVLSGDEAVRAAQNGQYGEAALNAAGAIPGGFVMGALAKGARAAKQGENIASRIIPVYNPPAKPPRPFELDYPNGAPSDAAGNLTHDIDGRPLTAEYIAGRRLVDGSDQALQSAEIRSIGEKTTGRDITPAPQRGAGGIGNNVGRVEINRYTRLPERIVLSDKLTLPQAERVLSHEVGHVIDQAAGEIPITGLSRELKPMYDTLNTGRERTKHFTGPEHLGYKGDEIPREHMADAIRAYMTDPNYIKTVSPKTAARIREYVNNNPKLKNIIQFNSLAAMGGAGAATTAPDDAKANDMANWWESSPVVEQRGAGTEENWWESSPLVEADPSFQNDGTVGPTQWRQQAMGLNENSPLLEGAAVASGGLIEGIPVVGPYIRKALDYPAAAGAMMLADRPVTFDEALQAVRTAGKVQAEKHPYIDTAAKITGGVAGTVPMMMAAPAAFGMGGGGLLARSAASAVTGAGLGAADSGVRSDFDPEAMGLGGGAGFLLGGVGPVAGQTIGTGVRKIANAMASRSAAKTAGMAPSALQYLNKAATRDGLDAPALQQRLADLGPNAMLMDVSPNLMGAAGALANHPGEAQTIIKSALAQRQAGANQRVISGLDEALGPAVNPRAVNETIRQGQRDLSPAYAESFRDALPVDTTVLASELDKQAFQMRGPAQKAAREVRSWLNIPQGDALDSNPYTLLQTRNAIDGKLATETDPQAIAVFTNARKQVDDALARNVPGIKMADAQFQELARQNEGLRIGVKALDSGREALRPDELRQAIVEGVNPEGLMVGPSAQTFRMKQAARADIDRQVGTKANDVVALKNVLKGEGDWNRDRIGMLFGQDRADKAISLLDREAHFANTNNAVTGNSFTQARAAAQKDLFPADAPAFGLKEAYAAGGLRGAARSAGTRAFDKIAQAVIDSGMDIRNVHLGEALAGNREAVVHALAQLQRQPDISPQVRRLVQAMMLERGMRVGEDVRGLLSGF
jgi:hypothetical protein